MCKKNAFNTKFIIIFIFAALLLPALPSNANECSDRWFPIPQFPYMRGAYPDWSATYWTYLFQNIPEDPEKIEAHDFRDKMLKFEGTFPYSRYMSFTVYDWNTGVPYGSLLDKEIVPDAGSQNPFVPGNLRNTDENIRKYTIKVVHDDSIHIGDSNVIIIPKDVEQVAIIMRIYLPDEGNLSAGGVGLPIVTSYLDESMTETTCPLTVEFENLVQIIVPPNTFPEDGLLEEKIAFYKPEIVEGNGLFANGNNPYMIAPFKEISDGEIALVRFRPPEVPDTYSGELESFTGEEDARYWSVCMVDISDSSTSRCINDLKAVLDEDGYFNLAIGSYSFFYAKPVEGWNYLPWGLHEFPALMMRQLEPRDDFSGNFFQVEKTYLVKDPSIPESAVNLETMTVDEFKEYSEKLINDNAEVLGDYSPRGIYCSEQAFIDGLCEIE